MTTKLFNLVHSRLVMQATKRSVTRVKTKDELGDRMNILNINRQHQQVLELFSKFNEKNIDECRNWTIIQVLKACAELRDIERGINIHKMITSRLKSDSYVLPSLIHFYMKCGRVHSAESLFTSATTKTIPMYGVMMKGFVYNNMPEKAIQLFNELNNPDTITLNMFFNACAQLGTEKELKLVKHVLSNVSKELLSHGYVLTSLVDALMACGDEVSAQSLFERSVNKPTSMYGAMMKGFLRKNMPKNVIHLFSQITHPDEATATLFLNACASLATEKELELLQTVSPRLKQVFSSSERVLASMVDAFMKCGDVDSAESISKTLKKKRIPLYCALIAGYLQNDLLEKAIDIYEQIDYDEFCRKDDHKNRLHLPYQVQTKHIDEYLPIHLSLLKAIAQLGLENTARRFVSRIPGFLLSQQYIQNALIDMWGKVNCVDEAKRVFDSLSHPDRIAYTAMINSYALNGMGVDAVNFYRRMPKEFVHEATYVCVLNACSHSGLTDIARSIFNAIENKTEKIYTTMVDCFSRAAAFEEAYRLIEEYECQHEASLPMYSEYPLSTINFVSFVTLLSGARNDKNSKLSQTIVNRMMKLFPQSKESLTPAFILLANVYASSGDLDSAIQIKNDLLDSGVKKTIGISCTEIDGKIVKFRAHDRSYFKVDELYAVIDRMSKLLIEHGHDYDASWIVRPIDPDETVESVLCGHSERLAIAAHFVGDRQPKRIQITKNLRVCGDCHRVTKLIALIFQCEIIVRDANRIHHFHKNGQCSCLDHF